MCSEHREQLNIALLFGYGLLGDGSSQPVLAIGNSPGRSRRQILQGGEASRMETMTYDVSTPEVILARSSPC